MFARVVGFPSALLGLIMCAFALSHAAAGELASAPIDVSMFRDGEVSRSNRQFGPWTLVCDEIARLHQRYCSLSSEPRDANGEIAATLVVSTGDDGRPAALLRAPIGVSIGGGAVFAIDLASATKAKSAQRIERRVDFVRCEQNGCLAVWSLSPKEITGLNSGGQVRLRYTRIQPAAPFAVRIAAPETAFAIESVLSGGGFSEAIQASIR
jgi:invasion protein IalB